MKTLKVIIVTLITMGILMGTALFVIGYFRPKPAGLLVDAAPQANVYVNGEFLGKTPFQKTLPAGEIVIKMVPVVADQNLLPYETKITLMSQIQTIVRREFGQSEDSSSGDIISFEKEGGNSAGLVVISTPENAQVAIDGVPRGFTPYKTSTVSSAVHQVTVRATSYSDRVMTVNTKAGYRLTLFAKLAKTKEAQAPTPTPTPRPLSFVLILNTPTGYLRVRTQPGTKGEEIGQVKPGDKYPHLTTDAETGWLQIQFEEPKPGLPNGITGWVSNAYAKEVEASASATETPL